MIQGKKLDEYLFNINLINNLNSKQTNINWKQRVLVPQLLKWPLGLGIFIYNSYILNFQTLSILQ